MDWITSTKIPVGRTAKLVFDWLNLHAAAFFNALSTGMQALIDGILWLLLTPPPLVIVAIFVAVAFAIQRK